MMDALTALGVIERLAGPATFERGSALYREQALLQYRRQQHSIQAKVQSATSPGVNEYEVELTIRGNDFDGGCNCPASEGFDFCKHCVVVALHYTDKLKQLESAKDGTPLEKITTYIDHLDEQSAKSALLALIEQDEHLVFKWQYFADIALVKEDFVDPSTSPQAKKLLANIKKLIIKAFPARDVWQYNKVRAYFNQAYSKVLDIVEMLDKLPADQAHGLAFQMLKRLDEVLDNIDDNGGFARTVTHTLVQQYAKTVRGLNWDQHTKARYILALYQPTLTHIQFNSIPKLFVTGEDPKFVQAFFDLLEHAVTDATNSDNTINSVSNTQIVDLAGYYAAQSQLAKVIALKQIIASSSEDYIALAKDSLALNHVEQAQAFIDLAHQQAKSSSANAQLLSLQATLAQHDAQPESALALQWQAYTQSLLLDDYISLNTLIGRLGDAGELQTNIAETKAQWLDKTIEFWLNMLATPKTERLGKYRLMNAEPLIELYLYCGKLTEAVALTNTQLIDRELLHQVAKVSQKHAPADTVELYTRLIHIWIKSAKADQYYRIVDLLLELQAAIVGLSDNNDAQEQFNLLLSEIGYEYQQKRQLLKMIQRHFVL